MDDADRAEVLNSVFLKEQIRKARGALEAGPAFQVEQGARFCLECGEKIPKARLRAMPGCQLCMECQQELERMEKHGARGRNGGD